MTYLIGVCPACRRTIGAVLDSSRDAMREGRDWLKHGLDVSRVEASREHPLTVGDHAPDCPTIKGTTIREKSR